VGVWIEFDSVFLQFKCFIQ